MRCPRLPQLRGYAGLGPGVEGGHLNICEEHLADIEAGVQYAVDTYARKLLLGQKPSE